MKSTQPNIAFEEHAILPVGLQNELPIHLISAPLSDIDHFYEDQKVRIFENKIFLNNNFFILKYGFFLLLL